MFNNNQRITEVSHPLVKDIYLKRDAADMSKDTDVLVIEAKPAEPDSGHSFADLLIDLQDIEQQAEQQVGRIDRVDIITH